jgi:hypothetical protein
MMRNGARLEYLGPDRPLQLSGGTHEEPVVTMQPCLREKSPDELWRVIHITYENIPVPDEIQIRPDRNTVLHFQLELEVMEDAGFRFSVDVLRDQIQIDVLDRIGLSRTMDTSTCC